MDLAVYMIAATFVVFFTIASVALAWSVVAGQWRNLAADAAIVLAIDDPSPADNGSGINAETGA